MDELGAHVSAQGGPQNAPERAAALNASVLQIFTKQPNRWAEPAVDPSTADAFRAAREAYRIRCAVSHDSYLINLSSPDEALWNRSLESFTRELERCRALALDLLVTHPGNATDRDPESGIRRNARGIARALKEVPGDTKVLLELTAGSGTSVGGTFEQLAAIRQAIPPGQRERVGICFDTCHAYAAGYDLVGDYDGVWAAFDAILGLEHLALFHLNDSRHPLGSHKDRHAGIGEGTLGEDPFRRLMTDPRFEHVPKILETPKGDDAAAADMANLSRLRGYRD